MRIMLSETWALRGTAQGLNALDVAPHFLCCLHGFLFQQQLVSRNEGIQRALLPVHQAAMDGKKHGLPSLV